MAWAKSETLPISKMTKAKKGLKMWFKQQNTFLVSMKP
jgi:hypothetical protein